MRRGEEKRVVESWGRQRVEKNDDDCCPLPYTVRTASFLITGATYASFFLFFLRWMLQEMLALRPAPPSATHLHSLTTLTHSLTHIYVYIYISLSPSAEAGALAAMQESAQPV